MEGKPDFSWLKDWRVRALAVGCLIVGFLVAAPIFGKPSHLAPNWGDIPTWLAVGVATVGGWIALSQLSSQRSQLRDQQEDLRRDAEDRRRAQASRIFISVPSADDRGVSVQPSVKNASDFPIYEAKFWYVSLDDLSLMPPHDKDYLGTILPGDETHGWLKFPSNEGLRHAIITFRDANNAYWIRMPGGVLEEQPARPERESVRAALGRLPTDLGPEGIALLRGPSEDAPDADDND